MAEISNAKIKVFGVGGGGTNAVNRMITAGLRGVEFIAANTDLQALSTSLAEQKLQLGQEITKGLGAGSIPKMGRDAAEESREEITKNLKGTDMVFIAAGMGGGTGTGASSVIAEIAKSLGILTVAVVTKPFRFEGPIRMAQAEEGLDMLRSKVDALITIPNDKLLQVIERNTPMMDALKMADDVLRQAAAVNPGEKFQLLFRNVLERLFVDRMDQNEDIFVRFMNDRSFQKVVTSWMADEAYRRLRAVPPDEAEQVP